MSENPSVPQPPQTGTHTPGWNDPPPMLYNPLSASCNTGRPKLNLNKRVAFPLQGSPTSTPSLAKPTAIVQPSQSAVLSSPPLTSLSPTNTPPLSQPIAVVYPMPNVNPPPPVNRLSEFPQWANETQDEAELPLDAKETSFDIFLQNIPLIQESQSIRRDEIERRMSYMEHLWVSGNLSLPVKQKLYKIAKAIKNSNGNEAMETYTTLVVNHSSECSFWATALRHIVLALQTPTNSTTDLNTTDQNDSPETTSSTMPLNCMYVPARPRSAAITPTAEGGEPSNSSSSVSNTIQHI